MQYMVLIYGNEKSWTPPANEAEGAAMMQPWFDYTAALKSAGVYISGEALQMTPTATTVRMRNGEPVFTDGPFAETKEQLGGFYVLDCPNLEEAMKWAARCPGVQNGSIELRPVQSFG